MWDFIIFSVFLVLAFSVGGFVLNVFVILVGLVIGVISLGINKIVDMFKSDDKEKISSLK